MLSPTFHRPYAMVYLDSPIVTVQPPAFAGDTVELKLSADHTRVCAGFGQRRKLTLPDGMAIDVIDVSEGSRLYKGYGERDHSRRDIDVIWSTPIARIAKEYAMPNPTRFGNRTGALANTDEAGFSGYVYEVTRPVVLLDVMSPESLATISALASEAQRKELGAAFTVFPPSTPTDREHFKFSAEPSGPKDDDFKRTFPDTLPQGFRIHPMTSPPVQSSRAGTERSSRGRYRCEGPGGPRSVRGRELRPPCDALWSSDGMDGLVGVADDHARERSERRSRYQGYLERRGGRARRWLGARYLDVRRRGGGRTVRQVRDKRPGLSHGIGVRGRDPRTGTGTERRRSQLAKIAPAAPRDVVPRARGSVRTALLRPLL